MSYEQLENVAMKMQQKLLEYETRLRSIDYVSMRLTYLFKVLENKDSFNKEYIDKCSSEIIDLLTVEEPENTTTEEK